MWDRRWQGFRAAALALALAAGDAGAGPAGETLPCPGDALSVISADPALAARVCDAAASARPLLRSCGLVHGQDVAVEIVESVGALGGNARCLSLYDCGDETIRILSPAALGRLLTPGNPLRALPADRLFDSLLVHELAHAALTGLAVPASRDRATQEYVAYALQFRSLAAVDRQALVDAFPRSGPVGAEEMIEEVHQMVPLAFGVNAWLHFDTPGNGCAFVRRLIDGTAILGDSVR